jgi:nucleoid-associated protein YgaU
MLAPHGGKRGIEGWGPFFSETGVEIASNGIRIGDIGRVMIDMLALEIVFLAVLFALIANTNWRHWKPHPSTLKKIAVFLLILAVLACAALWVRNEEDQRRQKAEFIARQEANDAQRKREAALATVPSATPEPRKYVSTDPNAGFDPDVYLASKSGAKDIFDLVQWKEEEKLIHDRIDYQHGSWPTDIGEAFVFAKFFERNLGDRKAELDALAHQLGAQRRYTLIEKKKQGGVWLVLVFLYRQGTQTYVVQTGDTLVSISRKFYNSTERSNAILDANRKNIRDPKKLTVGQTLVIP